MTYVARQGAHTMRHGAHIWFVAHTDVSGNLVAVEEHDWREGGCILPREGETLEQLFTRSALSRGVSSEKISEFLKSLKAG